MLNSSQLLCFPTMPFFLDVDANLVEVFFNYSFLSVLPFCNKGYALLWVFLTEATAISFTIHFPRFYFQMERVTDMYPLRTMLSPCLRTM